MTEKNKILTPEKFHEILHKDINKPALDFRKKWIRTKFREVKPKIGAHKASWARAMISLKSRVINIHVGINFKQNNLSDTDYIKLKRLAIEGISRYWSTRRINLNGERFLVWVKAYHSYSGAIPVDLYIETDNAIYSRSMNPATLGIDASFTYNKGFYPNIDMADNNFKIVSAHEFGHSVLMYAGGLPLSWGHKGSTNPLTQSVKSSAPGYPHSGSIDLMKYYDHNKLKIQFERKIRDSRAMEIDIKRLIWGAKIKWMD